MIRTAAALALVALAVAGDGSPSGATTCPSETGVAHLAFAKAGTLFVLDMPACSRRVLVTRGVSGPVRWSPDGKYVAFSGGVVAADGRRVFRGLRGTWGPRGHALLDVTRGHGVVLRAPDRRPRRLLPDGWGAMSAVWSRSGQLIFVARARDAVRLTRGEIWVHRVATGETRFVAGPFPVERIPVLATSSPRAEWVLWWPFYDGAASANADGVPLLVRRVTAGAQTVQIARRMLASEQFLSWCGGRLLLVAGADRYTTHGKRLLAARPPLWKPMDVSRDGSRSWTLPSCSRDGRRVAVSAGRNWVETRFGLERRSIWTMSPDGRGRRRLTLPPAGRSDELPRWSGDGQAVFFVRSGPTSPNAQARGWLYVVGRDRGAPQRLADLGLTGNYYGSYGWAYQTDLYVPRIGQSARR